MKTVIKIYREVEIPKEYEHFFKSSPRPNWKNIDWDKVDLDEDNFFNFYEEIHEEITTLNSTDEWEFVEY